MKPREVSTSGCVVCQAGPDVRVRVRSSVVQIEVEQTCVRAVAPIAAILSSHPKTIKTTIVCWNLSSLLPFSLFHLRA